MNNTELAILQLYLQQFSKYKLKITLNLIIGDKENLDLPKIGNKQKIDNKQIQKDIRPLN